MELDKIISGDSAVVLQSFPPDCIDLTVTSPPYDNLRTYNGFVFDFETIARELFRITKAGGVVVWVVADETKDGSESGTSFRQALYFMQCGFNLHDTMIYETSKPPKGQNRYRDTFEFMFVFSKGAPKTFNPIQREIAESTRKRRSSPRRTFQRQGEQESYKDRQLSGGPELCIVENIWYYRPGNHRTDDISKGHPARFPEMMAHDHIYSWSNVGDVVLDCCAGSGTTLKMAKILNRHYLGIEISPEYVTLAEKRLLATPVPLFGQERGLTPHAADAGDSPAQQAFFTPEVLSTPQGESTPTLRR
jgi:site-specific DNA-methyltransferase (adenine-specific)